MKFAHYEIEWWSWIYKSLTFENVNLLSVEAFIFYLEITALGYRWRIVLIVVDTA